MSVDSSALPRPFTTTRLTVPEQHRRPIARLRHVVLMAVVGLALAVSVWVPAASAAVLSYSTTTPMVLQNVSLQDLQANRAGICHSTFTHVIANFSDAVHARNYLNAAAACGLKVIVYFSPTVKTSTGTVYPTRVATYVNMVKDSPALWGYLSVKEPSWSHINSGEIRSLYYAFRKADPKHPVMALFGDIPHFGTTANPYTNNMANVVMVDWYPVETARGGCSTSGSVYVAGGSKWYSTKVRPIVAAKTPGVPVWVMVQTHKNLGPSCHKKQLPTLSQLQREVREAFLYAGASGIAFHTFESPSYTLDERRHPTTVSWMRSIGAAVAAGTFQ